MNGDAFTRWTVRAALLLYAATLALRLADPSRRRAARLLWTAGCLLFLAHVAAAFHFFHGWSHADAYTETARQTKEMTGTDWGGGLYLNYLFAFAWAADAAWWWWGGTDRYARRRLWVDVALHAFMLFMALNGTVVFEQGAVRWAGVACTLVLVALAARRRWANAGRPRRDSR